MFCPSKYYPLFCSLYTVPSFVLSSEPLYTAPCFALPSLSPLYTAPSSVLPSLTSLYCPLFCRSFTAPVPLLPLVWLSLHFDLSILPLFRSPFTDHFLLTLVLPFYTAPCFAFSILPLFEPSFTDLTILPPVLPSHHWPFYTVSCFALLSLTSLYCTPFGPPFTDLSILPNIWPSFYWPLSTHPVLSSLHWPLCFTIPSLTSFNIAPCFALHNWTLYTAPCFSSLHWPLYTAPNFAHPSLTSLYLTLCVSVLMSLTSLEAKQIGVHLLDEPSKLWHWGRSRSLFLSVTST